jgi:hypothetical protein
MARGGYRQPMNPAPVSGPGMLSQRTDGGAIEGMSQPQQQYTGMPYGQNKAVNDQQGAASLFAQPAIPQMDLSLEAPTAFPDEPMSFGADYGVGPGLDVSGIQGIQKPSLQNVVYKSMKNDPTGQLEAIFNRLNN